MSNMNVDTIYAIASLHNVPAPAPVLEAEALLEAAEKLRDSVNAETAPDLGKVTRKTLSKAHAALVEYENRDARLRAAEQLIVVATQQFEQTKFVHHMELEPPLAALYNDAADRFVAGLNGLGGDTDQLRALSMPHLGHAWRELSSAAGDLDTLSRARDAYAPRGNRADLGNDRLEELSRYAIVPDMHAVSRSSRPRDAAGWAELVGRGFVLRWQMRAAQEANLVSIREHAKAVNA